MSRHSEVDAQGHEIRFPPMNARYRIQQWFLRLEQPGENMKREDVCFLMVQARHLLEASAKPEQFQVAAFYADWTVHSALDRSIVCFEVLRDITRVIAENFTQPSPDLATQVSRIIGFPKLRAQLITLFRENGVPVIVFEHDENWKSFVAFLLWHVAGQPIAFPPAAKGRAKVIREEMLALPRPHNVAIERFTIVNHENVPHWQLEISGDKTFTMIGAVDIDKV